MFLFKFVAVNPQQHARPLQHGAPTLEVCLDALSELVKDGWVVQDVHYLDLDSASASWIALEATVFDGQLMSDPLQTLQQQWQAILDNAAGSSRGLHPVMVSTIEHQLQRLAFLIDHYTQAGKRTEQLLQQAWAAKLDEPHRSRLILHYEQTHQRFIEQVASLKDREFNLSALLVSIKRRVRLGPY